MKFKAYLITEATKWDVPGGTFTELIPVIWFMYGINPHSKSEVELYTDLMKAGLDKYKRAFSNSSNIKTAIKHMEQFIGQTKRINQHIKSAIGTYDFLMDQHAVRRIKNVVWAGSTKGKKGKREIADIIIKYADNDILGVSLKSGAKIETKEYLKNTSMQPMMRFILGSDFDSEKEKISNNLHTNVYKHLGFDKDYYKKPGATRSLLQDIEAEDSKTYNDFYDTQLRIVQDWFMSSVTNRKYKAGFENFIRESLLGKQATDLPIIQVKSANKQYKIMSDQENLELAVDKIDIIRAERGSGKQNIHINLHLLDSPRPIKMWFEIRAGGLIKGGAHKLGNFWNLQGVRYRGII
jgi:hypothetical protein